MIFLDHNAGAPVHPGVGERVAALLREGWANPSSPHASGRRAKELVEDAREALAVSVRVPSRGITFTSGATESNAAAIGHWARRAGDRRVVVCTPVEHPSVMEPLRRMGREGWSLKLAPVDGAGRVPEGWIDESLDGSVAFAACMTAQNETGALQPWREWSEVCAARGVPLHLDATQSWGKEGLDLSGLSGSASWSGHKLGALSGAGVVFLSEEAGFHGLAEGGAQERGRRAGTEPVLAVAALGWVAGHLPGIERWNEWARWTQLLEEAVGSIPGVLPSAPAASRLANTLHLRVPVRAETVVQRLDLQGVCASAGSACSSGSMRPSEALMAMGWSREDASRGLRLSVGHAVDEAGVRKAAGILAGILGASA